MNFNQAVDPASVDTSDLTLTGNAGGTVTSVQVNGNTASFMLHFAFGGSVTRALGPEQSLLMDAMAMRPSREITRSKVVRRKIITTYSR